MINLPALTQEAAFFRLLNDQVNNIKRNHILLLFKLYNYKSQNKYSLNKTLLTHILKIKKKRKMYFSPTSIKRKLAAYNKDGI